jgi:hypothetical protein
MRRHITSHDVCNNLQLVGSLLGRQRSLGTTGNTNRYVTSKEQLLLWTKMHSAAHCTHTDHNIIIADTAPRTYAKTRSARALANVILSSDRTSTSTRAYLRCISVVLPRLHCAECVANSRTKLAAFSPSLPCVSCMKGTNW